MVDSTILVIGAGLAGLRVAGRLAASGFHVAVADRLRNPGDVVRTTGIFVRRTLEDFDLPESLLGPPVRRISLYSPSLRRLDLESERDEFRVGKMRPIYHHYFERARRDGVQWLGETSFLSAIPEDGGSKVALRCRGTLRHLSVRYLVGADGARSAVAGTLRLDRNRRFIVGIEDVFRSNGNHAPRFHCFLDPRIAPGYLGWLVDDGEDVHVGVGGDPNRFCPASALDELERRVAHRLPSSKRVERRAGVIPVGGVLPRIANERGLLVGDAAGAVSPLTAGGLDASFRLSDAAARVIANYLHSCDASALEDYSGAAIRTRFVSRLEMRAIFEMVSSPIALETACAILRAPILRAFARHVFFGRGSFPDIVVRELAVGSRS